MENQNHLRIGDLAPDFKAETTHGPIRFHEWLKDSWCIFFSHPKDFTPVCTTELGTAARLKKEFDKRGIKMVSLSINGIDDHKRWVQDINDSQKTELNFPMIADPEKKIAMLYGMR